MPHVPKLRPIPILLAVVLSAACAGDPGEERLSGDAPLPAAAQVSPRGEAGTLEERLERLVSQLAAGMEGDPDRLLQAEAITDGLMEARRPVDWLDTGYDVEARLRQMQARADRIVALLRRGAALADVADEVNTLASSANSLRAEIRAGGGPAPPPLDSLLAQDPLRDVQAAAVSGSGEGDDGSANRSRGPLGTPVND
ncbi:MAG TPA: hypothetical protein VK966_10875 [Longimicrobiales bacterium]|nr:hypothetical protein [Longimicrobiales bacterium]